MTETTPESGPAPTLLRHPFEAHHLEPKMCAFPAGEGYFCGHAEWAARHRVGERDAARAEIERLKVEAEPRTAAEIWASNPGRFSTELADALNREAGLR